jgi:signal transduction histidine kinase/CheY-like chemotaxis protein
MLAIATRRGGVILLDRQGRPLRILNEASGLRADNVRFVYTDRQGGLWLALSNGLARIETGGPLSYWDKTTGLIGNVSEVVRHQGRIYAATTAGIYKMDSPSDGAAPHFRQAAEVTTQCWALLSTPRDLLAGCGGGLYSVAGGEWIWPRPGHHVLAVVRSKRDTPTLYLGTSEGLIWLEDREGQWIEVGQYRFTTVMSIVEDAQGNLWMGTDSGPALRLDAAHLDDSLARASGGGEPFVRDLAIRDSKDAAPGDPEPGVTLFSIGDDRHFGLSRPKIIAGEVVVQTTKNARLYRLETGAATFVPDTTFDAFLPGGSRSIGYLMQDDRGRVWIAAGADSGVARPAAQGGYTWAPSALRRLSGQTFREIEVEADGMLWIGGPNGLNRYDTHRSLDPSPGYRVWIRRITTPAGSTLFDGRPGDLPTEWPYRDNTLRVSFAAPRYDGSELTQYRVRLDGLDRAAAGDDPSNWSNWSHETDKDYTNLWEGRYTFRVQARDVYGTVSQEDTFTFRILPPWYRTGWAYGLYLLGLGGVVLAFARSQRKKFLRERIISDRLREVDRLKDEFLANTSHELRTPLFGITGLAESLAHGAAGELPPVAKESLAMITASGKRLSALVDDILDFEKLRRQGLELTLQPVDLRALVEVVLTMSRPLVGGKALELRNAVPADLPPADADENRLQQILYNLVGNAIKFTEAGHIEISAEAVDGAILVRISDTGIGISPEAQERIFRAFEQADGSTERQYGGTGLGLAVARELVELHGGNLTVQSRSGEGSTFSFHLRIAELSVIEWMASERPLTASPPALSASTAGPEEEAREDTAPAGGELTRGAHILVVDDEPVNLQVVSNFLRVAGFRLTLASNGAETLRLLEKDPTAIDLILLDVMMPGLSGFEVCRKIRKTHPLETLPILFLSATNRLEDRVAGLEEGGNDYLAKPIDRSELLARVVTHLKLLGAHRGLNGGGAGRLPTPTPSPPPSPPPSAL